MQNFFTRNDFKLLILIFFSALVINFVFNGCLVKFIFGINCPTCGVTRSIISLLRLDYKKAFYYFPLFPLIPFFVYTFIKVINENKFKKTFTVICFLFVFVYIFRVMYYKTFLFI